MKKLNFILIAVVAMFFYSCKDESGDFARTYYTDNDYNLAIVECLQNSVDTANAHLCVEDGFYLYKNSAYRVELPTSANDIIAKLTENEKGEMVDSLVLQLNRTLEGSGSNIRNAVRAAITETTFNAPAGLVNAKSNHAITDYFKSMNMFPLQNTLSTSVQNLMNTNGTTNLWNRILIDYREYETAPISIDLTQYATQQMLNHIFTEMALEEELIRKDTTRIKSDKVRAIFHQAK